MIVLFGTKSYGKVDKIPGVCHVATDFLHLQLVPLIPVGTFAIFSDNHRVRLPLSFKSIATAWFRVLLLLCGAATCLFAITGFEENPLSDGVVWSAITAAIIAVAVITYRLPGLGMASKSRQSELAHLLTTHSPFGGPADLRCPVSLTNR